MADPINVTDAKGRKLELRAMDPADVLDLMEAAGAASSNAGWMRYAMIVASVTTIDGVPVPPARDKSGVKALARQLGNEGFAAAATALFGGDDEAMPDAEAQKDSVKN